MPIPRQTFTFLYSGYQILKTGARRVELGHVAVDVAAHAAAGEIPVEACRAPLLAANVPGSWATISTSMLIAFSCDWTTAAISG